MEKRFEGEEITLGMLHFLLSMLISMIMAFFVCPQTGIYYLRTRPAVNAIQFTVSKNISEKSETANQATSIPELTNDSECLSCSA